MEEPKLDANDLTALLSGKKKEAVLWAKEILQSDFIILDTETTGLKNDDEVIEIAVIDQNGKSLMNQLVKPLKAVPAQVTQVNGITNEKLADATDFSGVFPQLQKLAKEKILITYNLDFDIQMLRQSAGKHSIDFVLDTKSQVCAMKEYAKYAGDYDQKHKSFKWKKLTGGDHTAMGDCLATLALIKKMAQTE